jgi:Fe-S oxidoreductase
VRRLAGIDRRRALPSFAPRTFTAWFASHEPPTDAASRPAVVLWPDTFTDRFAPEIGVAAVRVLEDAGYTVRLPSARVCCALTWTSTGQLDAARRILRTDRRHARRRRRRRQPDRRARAVVHRRAAQRRARAARRRRRAVRAVAAATRTLAEALAARRPDWVPPRLDGVDRRRPAALPPPRGDGLDTDQALLAACGAEVRRVGGCCGLAGDFGVTDGHYEISVAVAEQQLLPAVRDAPGAIVLADGFSCRTQLAGTAR